MTQEEQNISIPTQLAGYQPELLVTARGEAMTDDVVGEGDQLRVRLNMAAGDGDVVVAVSGGVATVGALFTDEQQRRWLVPRTERRDAVELSPDSDVRLIGVVVGIEKCAVRAASADCLKTIRRTLARRQQPRRPSADEVDAVITAVAPEVLNSRQWYAVYRALADGQAVGEGCFRNFALRVALVVPHHAHLPVAKELGRLAVQSFRKRVALWQADDAPVSGQRFADYLRIAQLTARLLKTSD